MDTLIFAFRNLKRRGIRTALTIFGIAIGIATIVGLLLTGESMSVHLTEYAKNVLSADIFISSISGEGFPTRVVESISQVPNVEAVSPRIYVWTALNGEKQCQIVGIDPIASQKAGKLKIVVGRGLTEKDEYTIVLGKDLAERKPVIKVGDFVRVSASTTTQTFQVIGISEEIGVHYGGNAYIPLSTAQKIFNKEKAQMILVKVKDLNQVNDTVQRLKTALKNKAEVTSARYAIENILKALRVVFVFLWVVAIAAVVAGGFCVADTMNMTVMERVREVGILKSIGGTRSIIMKLFISEALILGVLGSIVGLFLGILVSIEFNHLISRFELPGTILPLVFPPKAFIIGISSGLILTLIFSLYPVWKAIKVTPVQALKSEFLKPSFEKSLLEKFSKFFTNISFVFAFRNLSRYRFRSILLILGITFSIGTIFAVFLVGMNFKTTIANHMKEAIGSDIAMSSTDGFPLETVSILEKMPEVEAASSNLWNSAPINGERHLVVGVDPNQYLKVLKPVIINGRFLSESDGYSIVLSSHLADEHFKVKVGDAVLVSTPDGTKQFKIVGTVESMINMGHVTYIPLKIAQKEFGKDKVDEILIKVKDIKRTDEIAQKLKNRFKTAVVLTSKEMIEQALDILNRYYIFLLLIGFISIFVVALGILNATTMSIFERTREIGIMKAIGGSQTEILKLFLAENFLIGIIGGSLAFGFGTLFAAGFKILTLKMIGFTFDLFIPKFWIFYPVLMAVSLTITAGFYATYRAIKLKTIDALKYG